MNKLLAIFFIIVAATIPLALYVKSVEALEQTKDVEGVNYVSLTQMSKKYNLAYEEKDGVIRLTGEAVNLVVPKTNNSFSLNDQVHMAVTPPKEMSGEVWITALDWANMFNLSLTNYDRVSTMAPTNTPPAKTDAVLDDKTYTVGEEWGDRVPESVRKHGNITKITTPIFTKTPFKKEHYNEWKEDGGQDSTN